MRIKVWSRSLIGPNAGPFRLLGEIDRSELPPIGEVTEFGQVVEILPPIEPFTDDADQSVAVSARPISATISDVGADEGDTYLPLYEMMSFFPIAVDRHGSIEPEAFTGTHIVLESEGLTIEDVSPLLGPDTFSVWKHGCFLAARDVESLQRIRFAVVHRHSTARYANQRGESEELLNLTAACLSLIRPTRKPRIGMVHGEIKENKFDPTGFGLTEFVEVPMIQRLFTIRSRDVALLKQILPTFKNLYAKDNSGQIVDDFEPIRMAVQLYEQAYANSYWKARHILWWAAIEALYGNNEDAIMARIYSFFGDKNLKKGSDSSIYEDGDFPTCYALTSSDDHTLSEIVRLLYEVRNASAHGQKVADPHFVAVPHAFEGTAPLLDVLAEGATFIIRKTVLRIVQQKIETSFRDKQSREDYWLYEHGLNGKQAKKRLRDLKSGQP